MRWLPWLFALPLAAHTVSISTGELIVDGAVAYYRVRLPAYELPHVREPERTVLDAVQLKGASLTARHCERRGSEFLCEGKFVWAHEPGALEANINLASVIVGHHVHLLQATRGDSVTQAVFTSSQPVHTLVFHRAGSIERTLRTRPLAALVFLALVLTLAAQGLLAAIPAFAAGTAAAAFPWLVPPAFGEAAVALISAYCAFEALAMPAAPARWISSICLGAAAGLYSRSLQTEPLAGLLALAVLCGAALATALLLRHARPPLLKGLRIALLSAGLLWLLVILI